MPRYKKDVSLPPNYGNQFDLLYQKQEKLDERINQRVEKSEYKTELKEHYATKYFVYKLGGIFSVGLCGLYLFVTPLLIDKEFSHFQQELEKSNKKIIYRSNKKR